MSQVLKASGLFCFSALALGLMALSPTARAETGAFWEVNSVKLSGTVNAQAKNDSEHMTFLSTSGTATVKIFCGPIKLVGWTLSGTGGSGKLHYSECETFLNGTLAKRCTPRSSGALPGLIEFNALTALLLLHESSPGTKVDILDLKPTSGTQFVTLEFGEGLCALLSPIDITTGINGRGVTLKDCKNEGLVNLVEHLYEEGPLSDWLFGGNPISIDGSFWMFLAMPNAGQTFSGHPA